MSGVALGLSSSAAFQSGSFDLQKRHSTSSLHRKDALVLQVLKTIRLLAFHFGLEIKIQPRWLSLSSKLRPCI